MIVRALKRLEGVVDLYITNLWMGENGWYFTSGPEATLGTLLKDPLHGYKTIKELYLQVDPDYKGRITVPVLWDKKTDALVNNESSEIIRMLYTEFDDLLPEEDREVNRPGGGLYPEPLRKEIDEINDWVYNTVNNGVYKTGFAQAQQAYEDNLYPLFKSLDRLEKQLAKGPFLLGDHLTDADVRLFPTIARFDTAYVPVFMCTLKTIRHNYPNIYLWFRRLYWDQGTKTQGAFFSTTEPWFTQHGEGYQRSRFQVLGLTGPMIIPKPPAILIDKIEEGEKL